MEIFKMNRTLNHYANFLSVILNGFLVFVLTGPTAWAQERLQKTDKTLLAPLPANSSNLPQENASQAARPLSAREEKFKQLMTGAKLTGQFTVDGRPLGDLKEDAYEIKAVEKSDRGEDVWLITARVRYGKNDYEMPFPVQLKWAGEAPVMIIDNFFAPGKGTFSARVLLHGTKYAGTWLHDEVGGHMFGNIKLPETTKPD
jgi:hypothetical protein